MSLLMKYTLRDLLRGRQAAQENPDTSILTIPHLRPHSLQHALHSSILAPLFLLTLMIQIIKVYSRHLDL